MVNPNLEDHGEADGEDQLKNLVILHGQRGYGVGTRPFSSSTPLRPQHRPPGQDPEWCRLSSSAPAV